MNTNNKENVEPDKRPKVRIEQVNLNASDEESDKGEWAVVYNDSDSSTSSSKHDIAQKTDKTNLEKDPKSLTDSERFLSYFDLDSLRLPDSNPDNIEHETSSTTSSLSDISKITTPEMNKKKFVDLQDLHKYGIKIDDIDFAEDSSDIDIIDEEPSFDLLSPSGCDGRSEMSVSLSSVVSQYSSMSAIREHFLEQIAKQGLSNKPEGDLNSADAETTENSQDQAPKGKIRAYIHRRNAGLNGKLTFYVFFSITAVISLGVGHFLGWKNQFNYSHRLSMAQVIKLKQLQDDLLVCMRVQNEADFERNGFKPDVPFKQVCYRDFDYWKHRFETFFEENKGMMEVFQRTQKQFHENNLLTLQNYEYVTENECVNKTTSEAFNKLKLNILVRQMEHLNMLEVLEQVKKSEKQVKDLKKENEGLKKKLEEEELDDEEIVQEFNNRVRMLEEENEILARSIFDDDIEDRQIIGELEENIEKMKAENHELRSIFTQLELQMNTQSSDLYPKIVLDSSEDKVQFSIEDSRTLAERYSAIREKINQLMSENQEMKSNIARYRWNKDSPSSDKKDVDQKMEIFRSKFNVLQRQLQLEQAESKRWKDNFDNLYKKIKQMENDYNQQQQQPEQPHQAQQQEPPQRPQEPQQDSFSARGNAEYRGETISEKGKKFLHKFYGELKDKWEVLNKRYNKKFFEAYDQLSTKFKKFEANGDIRKQGDNLIKFGQYLEHVMEKVQNYSETLLEQGRQSQVVSFISDKLTDLTNIIENNFSFNQNKKDSASTPTTPPASPSPTPTTTDRKSKLPESDNNKKRKYNYYDNNDTKRRIKTKSKEDDWSTRRARARETYRKQH